MAYVLIVEPISWYTDLLVIENRLAVTCFAGSLYHESVLMRSPTHLTSNNAIFDK